MLSRFALICATLLALPAQAAKVVIECPPSIEVRQELLSAPADWHAAVDTMPAQVHSPAHPGGASGFSSGPAEEGALLAPEANGKWPIMKTDNVHVVCSYDHTSILLSRPVPAAATVCGLKEDSASGRNKAWCEVGS